MSFIIEFFFLAEKRTIVNNVGHVPEFIFFYVNISEFYFIREFN
jgi:hypothetical protein